MRKTFEVEGPGSAGALPLDERARRIFGYFNLSALHSCVPDTAA